jgi:hypothetical protein
MRRDARTMAAMRRDASTTTAMRRGARTTTAMRRGARTMAAMRRGASTMTGLTNPLAVHTRAFGSLLPRRCLRVGSLLAAALLALGVGACGGTVTTSSFKGEAHAVAQRISDLQSDVSAASDQKICEQDFSRAARARLSTPGNTCKQALKRQIGSIDDYELTVEKIAVDGATATARVRSTWAGKLRTSTLKLVKEGRSWRVESIA